MDRSNDFNSTDDYTKFHFAQAAVKIIHNVGFEAASSTNIEILTASMFRYFEMICDRVNKLTENRASYLSTFDLLDFVFKTQNFSYAEVYDYIQQVRTISEDSKIPAYPVERFVETETRMNIRLADPFVDRIPTVENVEETNKKLKTKYQQEKAKSRFQQSNVIPKPTEKPTGSQRRFDGNRSLPDFSSMGAETLGFPLSPIKLRIKLPKKEKKTKSKDKEKKKKSSSKKSKAFDVSIKEEFEANKQESQTSNPLKENVRPRLILRIPVPAHMKEPQTSPKNLPRRSFRHAC
ncbi:hypothetical protein M3Y94_00089500 [Aphelenchoides besseyi]|nr:hypothetical protein M3Y94_00089500 [Aphelenchoides besseyi]KAI6237703.1 hypothetical protein M3Y95_00293100 [Aphelenchoides besseyi]